MSIVRGKKPEALPSGASRGYSSNSFRGSFFRT